MKWLQRILFLSICFSTATYALPFSIQVNGSLPTNYPSAASYTITKNTAVGTIGNIIKWLPPNVIISAAGNTCTTAINTPFTLAMGQSCTLNLTIIGPVSANDSNPQHHLMICLSDQVSCAGPAPNQSINIGTEFQRTNFTSVGQHYGPSGIKPLTYVSFDLGVNWRASSSQPPSFDSDNTLQGVACSSDGILCNAIGFGGNGGGSTHPLSYFSTNSGNTWVASPPPPQANNDRLYSISCSSNGLLCAAVGTSNDGPLSYFTINGGLTWTLSTTQPQWPGSITQGVITSVNCAVNGLTCVSVGYYSDAGLVYPVTYRSADGGRNWGQPSSLSLPPGGSEGQLNGVACDITGQHCVAAGVYVNASVATPMAYITNTAGAVWSLSTPISIVGGGEASIIAVSCNSNGQSCAAVGSYLVLSGIFPVTYFTTNGGNTWEGSAPAALPLPGFVEEVLNGVKCNTKMSSCAAVGFATDGSTYTPISYVSTDGGVTWTFSTTMPPMVGGYPSYLQGVG